MKIAVVGSGISGLASAWLLNQSHEVILFEAADYLGGHTNTVDVTLDGLDSPVDTGFLVHNDLTYPNLVAMLDYLDVNTYASDMSFSVQIPQRDVEWSGTSLNTVFGQKRNLLRPQFLVMLKDILHFNSRAEQLLREAELNRLTLGELLAIQGYSRHFRDWYLLPMAAAIWSSTPSEILKFPASTFLRFCLNHRLLQVNNRPQWRSIAGGGRCYVDKLAADLNVRLTSPVDAVTRTPQGVRLHSAGHEERFDSVVFATHAPDSLRMLTDADQRERAVLGNINYQPNLAILHTDRRFLPRRKPLWSAWNYLSNDDDQRSVCVTYLLNQLQRLPFESPLMVTLNPPGGASPAGEIARFEYSHPVFDHAAIQAQKLLPSIQGRNRAWFCGAWAGYGFHEDGLNSALAIAEHFNVEAPWNIKRQAA